MNFKNLLVKDMKNILYDVKSLAIIILMPVVLMSILGMSLQGVFGEEGSSGIASTTVGIIKDYDMEAEMAKVRGRVDLESFDEETLEGLDAEKNFFSLMDSEEISEFLKYEIMTEEDAFRALENQDVTALIRLPKNFIYNNYMMLSGSRLVTDIEYYINPDNDFFAGIILGILESYTDTTNQLYAQQRLIAMKAMGSGNLDEMDSLREAVDTDAIEEAGIELTVKGANLEESINSFQYYAAAIMCMFLLYTAGIGGRALLEEKREFTIPRLAVGGHGVPIAVASNFLRVMFLAMFQSLVMITYSSFILGVDWGSPVNVAATVVLSSFAVASIGMLVGVITLIADNYKAANAFEFGIVYVMALVGGSFIPVEGLPKGLQQLGFLSVNGQALKMYINGMYGLPLADSMTSMMVLLVFGIVFIGMSAALIVRKKGVLAC